MAKVRKKQTHPPRTKDWKNKSQAPQPKSLTDIIVNQRRARPTASEIITGLTRKEIARRVDYHYNYVGQKLLTREGAHDLMHRLNAHAEKYSIIDTDKEAWLMPQHPDYNTWRYTHTIKLLENTYGPL